MMIDCPGYRNHVNRVRSAMYFLNKYDETYRKEIEIALVYHDIGLWTHSVLDYLAPSSEVAANNLPSDFTPTQSQLVYDIIVNHHKITNFTGAHADVVNAVRKRDWIDATLGIVHMGMSRANIAAVKAAIPEEGFHNTRRNRSEAPRLELECPSDCVVQLGHILS